VERRQLVLSLARQAGALLFGLLLFLVFVAVQGRNPLAVLQDLAFGAFGNSFAWQNTLVRTAPLLLTALCTIVPAQAGIVIIGNEGALLMGGLGAVLGGMAFGFLPAFVGIPLILVAGALLGALWISLSGVLRQVKGVDPTISSLLLYYVGLAIFLFLVEGPLRDPATLNKPSSWSIPETFRIGRLGSSDVHVGLLLGLIACVGMWVLLKYSAWGFGVRIAGGNARTAAMMGLPRNAPIIAVCAIGGACAGLAGAVEVSAIHYNANASLASGYGFAGILVAFAARQNPLGAIPVSLLLGGLHAAGGILQRRHGLSDASINVLQGLMFLAILMSDGWGASSRRTAKG